MENPFVASINDNLSVNPYPFLSSPERRALHGASIQPNQLFGNIGSDGNLSVTAAKPSESDSCGVYRSTLTDVITAGTLTPHAFNRPVDVLALATTCWPAETETTAVNLTMNELYTGAASSPAVSVGSTVPSPQFFEEIKALDAKIKASRNPSADMIRQYCDSQASGSCNQHPKISRTKAEKPPADYFSNEKGMVTYYHQGLPNFYTLPYPHTFLKSHPYFDGDSFVIEAKVYAHKFAPYALVKIILGSEQKPPKDLPQALLKDIVGAVSRAMHGYTNEDIHASDIIGVYLHEPKVETSAVKTPREAKPAFAGLFTMSPMEGLHGTTYGAGGKPNPKG